MDKKQHRHSSFSSSYPAPSRPSLPCPPPRRSTSLKHAINCEFSFFACLYFIFFFVLYLLTSGCTDTSEPPPPASLVRVKGQMAMNTPPPKSSGTLASRRIHTAIPCRTILTSTCRHSRGQRPISLERNAKETRDTTNPRNTSKSRCVCLSVPEMLAGH